MHSQPQQGRRPGPIGFLLLIVAVWLTACGKLTNLVSTPTPSPTLTPSPTPSPTATATATPRPTPTSTLPPSLKLDLAEQAWFAGDWALALRLYQATADESSDPALRAAALFGLGRTHWQAGEAAAAVVAFTTLLEKYPEAEPVADVYFLLGEIDRATERWADAIVAYQRYQALRPGVLDSYVYERIGLAALANGDYTLAREANRAAIAAPRISPSEVNDLRERLAQAYGALGDTELALAEYDLISADTNQNWRKAHVAVVVGQVLYNLGRTEEAYAKFLEVVNDYPEAGDAFTALVVLVNDGVPVSDRQRGLVNYFAQNYEPALDAFQRVLDSEATTREDAATALYYAGLSRAALSETNRAIANWRIIVDNYPATSHWIDAYFQIAFIQPYPDDTETFLALASAAPTASEAPDALYRAARLHERNRNFKQAVELWSRIATEYPTWERAADAAMQAGVVLWRTGEIESAAQAFELARTLAADPTQTARAWLWLGKAHQQQGDTRAARTAWQTAATLDPHGYYSLRAEALLRGERILFVPPARYSVEFDREAEYAQVTLWLKGTFPLAQNVEDVHTVPDWLWQEGRMARGAALWRLGLLPEAHAEFDSLRQALSADPLTMWPLALYFNQIGAYDLSIRSARAVVDAAGYADTLRVPRLILRLRYPFPFADRIVAAAAEQDLHPFLMLSKMRIESFFWKYAFSSAEARGLNQIIPATADSIAERLGLSGFTYADLYRPALSIPMGAFYLHEIGTVTGAAPEAMLAGYYAGPGNAQVWQDLAGDDADLFVEVIRLPDAKGYVQTCYEYWAVYAEVYGD